MTEKFTTDDERVDYIPLLMAHMERMGIPALLDEYFPTHGNWEGLSLGWVATGWLAHILSQADHRMNRVQGWAAKRLETLQFCTGEPVRELDFADDRLVGVLRHLSDDEQWDAFESALNGHLLRVYPLEISPLNEEVWSDLALKALEDREELSPITSNILDPGCGIGCWCEFDVPCLDGYCAGVFCSGF